jgi:hypothetical protein
MRQHSPRAFPLGVAAPVGTPHVKVKRSRLPRERQPRERKCLRKGCRRKYVPRRWNQRYCRDPECQREVHRWQAARRQANHRTDETARRRHAQAERERRQRARALPKVVENPAVIPARGHAAEIFFPFPYATGRAATNAPWAPFATRHGIAAWRAVKRSATCKTGNASGSYAAPWMAAPSGLTSIESLVRADLHS